MGNSILGIIIFSVILLLIVILFCGQTSVLENILNFSVILLINICIFSFSNYVNKSSLKNKTETGGYANNQRVQYVPCGEPSGDFGTLLSQSRNAYNIVMCKVKFDNGQTEDIPEESLRSLNWDSGTSSTLKKNTSNITQEQMRKNLDAYLQRQGLKIGQASGEQNNCLFDSLKQTLNLQDNVANIRRKICAWVKSHSDEIANNPFLEPDDVTYSCDGKDMVGVGYIHAASIVYNTPIHLYTLSPMSTDKSMDIRIFNNDDQIRGTPIKLFHNILHFEPILPILQEKKLTDEEFARQLDREERVKYQQNKEDAELAKKMQSDWFNSSK